MPSICTCPDCHQRVLVESLADESLRLRCPLCSGTFEIAAVSADAEPAPPWALPLLDERSADSEPAADAQHPESAESLEIAAEGFAEGQSLSIAEVAAAADRGTAGGDQAALETWMPPQSDTDSTPLEGSSMGEPSAVWDAMGQHAGDVASPSRARRREPQVGIIGNLIGVVLGGVVGIGLGYLVLLWVAGRQGDFLHIWDQMPRILLPSEP
ncbi:MAG TPA: hypothetical protein VHV55_13680 [Pirellulales bacterium]|nr:hypothetical protein [Pirellulales bacterium]